MNGLEDATGGSAFPIESYSFEGHGMSLLDYFAAKSLPFIYQDYVEGERRGEYNLGPNWRDGAAKESYLMAVSMLEARKKLSETQKEGA